jgi:predicted GIY-YIG superfamily endonuclease
MTFHVYMLHCADGSFYVGQTEDLERRIAQHQLGSSGAYTKSRRPIRLVFAEAFAYRDEALARERQVKGWSRAKKQALVRDSQDAMSRLAMERRVLRRLIL